MLVGQVDEKTRLDSLIAKACSGHSAALTEILLGHLQGIVPRLWPGIDGLTLDEVVESYCQAATVGKAYALKLKVTGGVKPLKWRSLGKLPAGLKLGATTGALTGTPTKAGKLTVTIRVTDGLRASFTQTFTITVK